MSAGTLHIISFAIPFPANYGGAMDVFYKLKALAEQGVEIILHCWKYNNTEQAELEKYCQKVFYYERRKGLALHLSSLPYIVASRQSEALLENICKDQHPILFEGIHTTALILHPALQNRKKYLRQHNVEWSYYEQLASVEPSWWKKVYFLRESKKLRRYEKEILPAITHLFAVSENDATHYPGATVLPVFQAFNRVETLSGLGSIMLYQADLGIPDNATGALVIAGASNPGPMPLVIAGRNVPKEIAAISDGTAIRVIDTPDDDTMQHLQQDAQINFINSRINSGMKIKLIQLLLCGRWCLVNNELRIPAELEVLVVRYSTSTIREKINQCSTVPLEEDVYQKRKEVLQNYLPENLAKSLLRHIFD